MLRRWAKVYAADGQAGKAKALAAKAEGISAEER